MTNNFLIRRWKSADEIMRIWFILAELLESNVKEG
jgi:hypothetical protein